MEITTIVLYDTALCNLHCKYCFIQSNKILKAVDKELEESFLVPHYYLNLLKTITDNFDTITRLEIWGGETTLFLERIFPTLRDLIDNCPNLKTIKFSSNYTTPKVREAFKNLNDLLKEYTPREFIIESQISLDGPPELTDAARGKGVTQALLENLYYLVENNYFCANNVICKPGIKSTLDIESMRKFLNKDYIIYYYQWFEENIVAKVKQLSSTIKIYPPVPNIADPAQHTQEDGKIFAQIIQNCYDIQKENNEKHYFKYYKNIVLYPRKLDNLKIPKEGFSSCGGFCSSGKGMVGLLPNNQFCVCHRAFADYLAVHRDFSQDLNIQKTTIVPTNNKDLTLYHQFTFTNKHDLEKHCERVSCYFNKKDTFIITNLISMIHTLAACGQIDTKYQDIKTARDAAYKFIKISHGCYYSNSSLTGHMGMFYTNLLKLFLNGAIDVYEKEGVFH